MAPPQKQPLRALTAEEQTRLERIARSRRERARWARRVRRARALPAVAAGQAFAQAAAEVGVHRPPTVAQRVGRLPQRGLAARVSAAGRGRNAPCDGTARAPIGALAPQASARRHEGTAPWSRMNLERPVRQQEALAHLGTTTLRRVRADAGSSSQRPRRWCPTGSAPRPRKAGVVTVTDPAPARTRGAVSRRTRERRRPGEPSAPRMKPGRSRRCPPSQRAGSRKGIPPARPRRTVRTGPANRLTVFRPATGAVTGAGRAKGGTRAPNAVRPPGLQAEREPVLATVPEVTTPEGERPPPARWATGRGHPPPSQG